uniref:Uncharacterized protein n=1 Tax=Picea sitchensis TaxID=3332 RepID=B8LP21_PICSI|nr:unknown [Picea sitchensis]
MAGIGWYGPLIDLSAASSHLGAYVQLLVFVHQFHPPQRFKASNGRELLKAMLQVGDNTQPYFHVSLWQKNVYSNVSAGDVILLQNVKVTKFRDVAMATTIQHSSLSILVQLHELLSTDGIDETIEKARMGIAMKEKLRLVILWSNHTQSTLLSYLDAMRGHNERPHILEANEKQYKNWLCSERSKLRHCSSVADVTYLREPCVVSFFGNIGEICLPSNVRSSNMASCLKDWIFVSKGFLGQMESKITEAFICIGCKNCGCPMEPENKSSYANQSPWPLYCGNYVNKIHHIGRIYSPFLLHVWDKSANIPILVKNLAAQQLFGNVSAETISESLEVFHSPTKEKRTEATPSNANTLQDCEGSYHYPISTINHKEDYESTTAQHFNQEDTWASEKSNQLFKCNHSTNKIDFSKITLVLMLSIYQTH